MFGTGLNAMSDDYGDSDWEGQPMSEEGGADYSSGGEDYAYSEDEAEAASPLAKGAKVQPGLSQGADHPA